VMAVIYSSLNMLYFTYGTLSWLGLPTATCCSGAERPPLAIPQTGFPRQGSLAKTCSKVELGDPKFKKFFNSQSGEDRILLQWFNGLCAGTYLEMGALDGVTYSNSYFFNHVLNWTGLLVEMGPDNFVKLEENRPNELAVVHAAVCDVEKEVHYIESGAVSGIVEFAGKAFQDTWWKDRNLSMHNITCSPLRNIVEKHVGEPFYFDFFSLDIEGAELTALQSLDFSRIGFGIILVECDEQNPLKNMALRFFLKSKGYEYFDTINRSWWFFNVHWASIYKDLLY